MDCWTFESLSEWIDAGLAGIFKRSECDLLSEIRVNFNKGQSSGSDLGFYRLCFTGSSTYQ